MGTLDELVAKARRHPMSLLLCLLLGHARRVLEPRIGWERVECARCGARGAWWSGTGLTVWGTRD